MPDISKEIVALLQFLLPGLLAAWVFFGLTSHVKPSQFERVIQALIFTFLVQVILPLFHWVVITLGKVLVLGSWDKTAETISSAAIAVIVGAAVAYLTNTDSLHRWLRSKGFSTRTAHPSEWHNTFSEYQQYVILHLTDDRRLAGWPRFWPSDSDKGHFFIIQPSWILDNEEQGLDGLEGVLVNVKDVKWIEFVKQQGGEKS
jgi:hypothetical protein